MAINVGVPGDAATKDPTIAIGFLGIDVVEVEVEVIVFELGDRVEMPRDVNVVELYVALIVRSGRGDVELVEVLAVVTT